MDQDRDEKEDESQMIDKWPWAWWVGSEGGVKFCRNRTNKAEIVKQVLRIQ